MHASSIVFSTATLIKMHIMLTMRLILAFSNLRTEQNYNADQHVSRQC